MEVTEALAKSVAALPAGGEARPGQVEMAMAVAAAVEEGRHLVVQAGTGTGKSLAYLVPLILSGKRIVVATATKALQDQLGGKDLPFLVEHLGVEFQFAVLKGRSNYLCLQKAGEIGEQEAATLDLELGDLDGGQRDELVAILKWAMKAKTGDRADLPFEPSARTWSAVSVGAEECPGVARCPKGEHCFADAARQRAADADVVVVNSHLYGVHVASGGFVLPEHDVVVFDEAHELEDVAAATLGLELGAGRFRALARILRGVLAEPDLPAAVEDAANLVERALFPHRDTRLAPAALEGLREPFAAARLRIDRAVEAVRAAKPDVGTRAAARKERALKAGGGLAGDLDAALGGDERHVAWVEGPEQAPRLKVAPIVVAELLAEGVWNDHTAVLTSATIPPGLARRVGLPPDEFDQLDAGSPFDHRTQAMLYVARHLPNPRDPGWPAAAIDELEALMRAAGGRTLALFTSWRMMDAAAERLVGTMPWTVLTQRDLPKPALIRAFTGDETSCLLATLGFWQGVDVPGRALSLVVLDRIPFPRPDEPLNAARRERAGEGAFAEVDLPRAATLLAQGAGRLIRSTTDRGVVAVLDSRLARSDYRRVLLAPLPPMKRTVNRAEVEAFLQESLANPQPN